MGIPSYYKKLAKQFKGFYCTKPDSIKWLLIDYNCLIYQVLASAKFEKFPGFSDMAAAKVWEKVFIEQICNYTNDVIELACPEKILIALDGVVPLAKMRQQRMRRFKSVALNGTSLENWDTNAITPGTDFMITLAAALRRRFPTAHISDTSEYGEGEHKIMEYLRGLSDKTAKDNVVIYGLDGDLFVLGLLANQLICPKMNFYFLREEQQSGKTKSPAVELVWLSLNVLKAGLISYKSESISNEEWLTEYAVAMSLLGNDFVPNGLGFRIKEGGHERLLTYLNQLHSDSRLVIDGELNSVAWGKLFDWLARDEEKAITASVRSKIQAAAKGSVEEIDKPLLWVNDNEGQLWNSDGERLRKDWQLRYARYGLLAPSGQEEKFLEDSVKQYIYAIEWTYTYYCKGADNISFDWMYNFPTAPLFSSVARQFKGFDGVKPSYDRKPTAHEQLALVLPAESYWLIPRCPERQLLAKAQWLFPKKWEYYSFGKRMFWECEAHIPIPTIKQVRELI